MVVEVAGGFLSLQVMSVVTKYQQFYILHKTNIFFAKCNFGMNYGHNAKGYEENIWHCDGRG